MRKAALEKLVKTLGEALEYYVWSEDHGKTAMDAMAQAMINGYEPDDSDVRERITLRYCAVCGEPKLNTPEGRGHYCWYQSIWNTREHEEATESV